jgi:hypothetical protein
MDENERTFQTRRPFVLTWMFFVSYIRLQTDKVGTLSVMSCLFSARLAAFGLWHAFGSTVIAFMKQVNRIINKKYNHYEH